jgi:hypothetical protein
MTRARDVSRLITTPPSIYATDTEASAAYIPLSSPVNGFKNKIINGDMSVWQRGTSFSIAQSTALTYTADRWNTATNANQAVTVSRQPTNDTTNLPFIQYCLRYQRNSGQTGTAGIYLFNNFESINSIHLAGKTVTFSFYARAGANYSPTSSILDVKLQSGTGTDLGPFVYTGATSVISSNATLTTTWQRFSYSGTIPTTATQIEVYFVFNPTGTASTNDYFEITGLQLEAGHIATTFENRPIGAELALCQRYYQELEIPIESLGAQYTSAGPTFISNPLTFQTTMRTTPSSITYTNIAGGNFWVIAGIQSYSANSVTGQTFLATPNAVKINQTRQSGGATPTVGNYYIWEAKFKLGMSAEL